MRYAFFGTPEFAVPTLRALGAAGRVPCLVVSQPDRPAGRGRELRPTPVAAVAREEGWDLVQPARVRDPEFVDRIVQLDLDLGVVAAFGQIFPEELLRAPRHGCINVHASLLPRHRGAAPIQAALRARDPVAGVCTMQMEAGLDTGPVIDRAETPLSGRETAGELSARLSYLGAALLLQTFDRLAATGELPGEPQDEGGASYAPRLTREDGRIDWRQSAEEVDAQVRAMTPWPGAHSELAGQRLKVLEVLPLPEAPSEGGSPGILGGRTDAGPFVHCGRGAVTLLRVQRPGRRPVSGDDLVNGERLQPGVVLG